MAKDRRYTPHQKGIIRRYYENKDDIANQKLAELVSDLFVARLDPSKKARLWKQVGIALKNTGMKDEQVKNILVSKDLKELAKLVNEMF